jgi:hypothetical protein
MIALNRVSMRLDSHYTLRGPSVAIDWEATLHTREIKGGRDMQLNTRDELVLTFAMEMETND